MTSSINIAVACFVTLLLAEITKGGLVPPYIRTHCSTSIGEPYNNAWCIDPAGRQEPFQWDNIHAHSCKMRESAIYFADQQWTIGSNGYNFGCDTSIGQLYGGSDTLNGRCLAAECDDELCSLVGVLCDDAESLTVWKYDHDSGHLQIYGSLAKSIVVASGSSEDDCDSYDEESSDSSEYDLCLRIGTDIRNSMAVDFFITDIYLDSCDMVDIYGVWDIIGADDVDEGPQC